MRIAFTHNLRLTDSEEEAEFDTAETVDAIAGALERRRARGREDRGLRARRRTWRRASRPIAPDLIFNTAEGRRGRAREAFYPALFEELGFPYTGSDAYVLTVTLDKWLTKLRPARAGRRHAARRAWSRARRSAPHRQDRGHARRWRSR